MAGIGDSALFPNSKMAMAVQLGQSRFHSGEATGVGSDVVPAVTPTTFNPADLTAVTLSGGNLVATSASPNGGVRGAGGLSSGKYYFEFAYTTINTNGFGTGIALASATVVGTSGTGIVSINRTTGQIVVNGTGSGIALGIINPATIVGIAVDLTSKLIWFRFAPAGNWNNNVANNPATGAGGVNIATISTGPLYPIFYGQLNDKCTANFGATAFVGAVPSGFTAGWFT